MNTEHLAYILEAHKCGSVNKAARNCYISQSHLSAIIKSVESEIGYPLFYRTHSGIVATPEGMVFMSHAEKIVTERDNILKIPEAIAESDNLSIICARSAFVLQCFFDYKKLYPNLSRSHDKFLEAGLKENLKNVVARNCRLGILVLFEQVISKYMEMADEYNLELTILQHSIPVTAFMPRSHPLARAEQILTSDLAGYPFIADAHIDHDDTLEVLGIREHKDLLYVCDRGTIFDAVCKGGYIAIGISIPDEDAQRLNCVCRPIIDGAPMAVGILYPRTVALRPREKHFIRYLTERLRKRYPHKKKKLPPALDPETEDGG